MQLKDTIYLALVASCALGTQATHLPREHHHLQRRQFDNDTAWTAWTSDAASTDPAPTSLDTAVAAADTASSTISPSSPSWFAWPSNATQADPATTSLSLVLSSATFTYTMGVGPSKTVVTMTTVITSTFTNTLTVYGSTPAGGNAAALSTADSAIGSGAQPPVADVNNQAITSAGPATTIVTSTTTTKTVTVVPANSSPVGGTDFQNPAGGAAGCAAATTVTETVKSTITMIAPSGAALAISSLPGWGAPAGASATPANANEALPATSSSGMPPSVSAGAFFGNGTAPNTPSWRAWGSTGFLTVTSGRAVPSDAWRR